MKLLRSKAIMSTLVRAVKKPKISEELLESFSKIPDKRINRQKLHPLKNILIIAVCAILCGADSWLAIEKIGKSKLQWFRKFLWLPHGIPSHDTFARIFVWLDPIALQQCFVEWASELRDLVDQEIIAIDGKTQRRSFDAASKKPAIHMVTAFACESGIALGMKKVASKSNEIIAIPEVLNLVDIKNSIVTIDAIGCQKNIAEEIREKDADYILALKKNQPNLYLQVVMLLHEARKVHQLRDHIKFYETENLGHGRREIRRYWI